METDKYINSSHVIFLSWPVTVNKTCKRLAI